MPQVPALPIIRSAISQGLSANRAYQNLREAARQQSDLTGERWTGISRATFLEQYAATVALRARVPDAMQADIEAVPGDSDIIDRPSTRGTGYLTWLQVHSRQIGSSEVDSEYFVIRTNQPISPAQAMDTAEQGFVENAQTEHGTRAGYLFLGATYTGTERLQPQGRG